MNRSTSSQQWLLPALATVSSGAMYFFSTGLEGFRPLVWIAPLPVLLMATRSSRRLSAAIAFGAYFLGGLNLTPYLARIAPIGVVFGELVIPGFAFALVVVAYRDALLHVGRAFSFAAFPIGWTVYEYILSNVSPHGTAGSIAYTQSDFLPLVQISALTGIWGITFVLMLVPAGIAAAVHNRTRKKDAVVILLISLFIGIASLTYGWLRLSSPPSQQSVRFGVAAIDSTVRYFNTTDRKEALGAIEVYARVIDKLAAQGAKVVVLPEKCVGVTEEYEGDLMRILGEAARSGRTLIVAGFNRLGSDPHRNTAVLISSDGNLLAEYDKVYPIPGLESGYRRGEKTVQISISDFSAGIAICKDMDFPRWIRQYGGAGAGILFIPAWDFTADAWLHSRMAIVRCVENGLALVRSANDGFLTVADDRGRIVGEASSSQTTPAVLLCDVNPGSGRTFYATNGDWFAWTNIFLLLILIVAVSSRIMRRLTHNNA